VLAALDPGAAQNPNLIWRLEEKDKDRFRERVRTKGRIFKEIRETKYGKDEKAKKKRREKKTQSEHTPSQDGEEKKTGFYGHRSLFVFTILIAFKNRFRALVALRLFVSISLEILPVRRLQLGRGGRWRPHVLLIFLNYL
jgi:hypothetical protein